MTGNANLYAALDASFERNADGIAIETIDGARFTYAQVRQEAARYAAFLSAQGLQKGDRVAVQVDKSAQSLFLYLGCLRAGFVYLPLNTAYRAAELGYFLGDAEPALTVTSSSAQPSIAPLVQEQKLATKLFTLDGDGRGSLTDALGSAAPHREIAVMQPDDLAVIIYTSGRPAAPRGPCSRIAI
jgi:malonyl-CoA/methylmalonyl-CoA synthetase